VSGAKPNAATAELYAHALAIEREAAARYAELARSMAEQGNAPTAALFAHLATRETRHAESVAAAAKGLDLPVLKPWEYHWLDGGPPEKVARELVPAPLAPEDALKIALEAEQRAHDFFEQAFAASTDPDVKLLAAAMAQEEARHVEWLELALATASEAGGGWAGFLAAQSGDNRPA